MFSHALTISALAACVMAAPPVPDLSARDLDFTVKFHANEACTWGGPERNYDAGSCLPLGSEARGLEIVERSSNCYVTAYTGGSCNGEERKLDANGCWTLSGRQSLKFNCD